MKCPFPEERSISPKHSPGVKLRIETACGRCPECLAKVRLAKAGQSAMEGLQTVEKLGLGHIFMAGLTYAEAPETEPAPINLATDIVPVLRRQFVEQLARRNFHFDHRHAGWYRREDHGDGTPPAPEYLAEAQRIMLRRRWRFSHSDIAAFEAGDYPPALTLQYADVDKYIKRLRKSGLQFRYFCAAEYGEYSTIRPHYHVLFFGLTRNQFEQALKMWPHGTTDPNPHTRLGQIKLDAQISQNANARAAGAYASKYLAKGSASPRTIADAARQLERTRASSKPGLGFAWALRNMVPLINAEWRKPVAERFKALLKDGDGPLLDTKTGEIYWPRGSEILRAYAVDQVSRQVNIGQRYPVTTYLRNKVLMASDVPDELMEAFAAVTSYGKADELLERENDPAVKAEHDKELLELREEHQRREEQRTRGAALKKLKYRRSA